MYCRRIRGDSFTAQKLKFPIKDSFSKCDQIRRKLGIWSHLLKKSLMENFIFCAVFETDYWDTLQLMSRLVHWMKSSNEDEIKSSKNIETSQKKMRMWESIVTVSYVKAMFFMWSTFIKINLKKLFLLIAVFRWCPSFNV